MRTIKRSSQFKTDYRQIKANPRHASDIDALFATIVTLLATDQPLPEQYRDHDLVGDWRGHRECHVKPDLLLIYSRPDADTFDAGRAANAEAAFTRYFGPRPDSDLRRSTRSDEPHTNKAFWP